MEQTHRYSTGTPTILSPPEAVSSLQGDKNENSLIVAGIVVALTSFLVLETVLSRIKDDDNLFFFKERIQSNGFARWSKLFCFETLWKLFGVFLIRF